MIKNNYFCVIDKHIIVYNYVVWYKLFISIVLFSIVSTNAEQNRALAFRNIKIKVFIT